MFGKKVCILKPWQYRRQFDLDPQSEIGHLILISGKTHFKHERILCNLSKTMYLLAIYNHLIYLNLLESSNSRVSNMFNKSTEDVLLN